MKISAAARDSTLKEKKAKHATHSIFLKSSPFQLHNFHVTDPDLQRVQPIDGWPKGQGDIWPSCGQCCPGSWTNSSTPQRHSWKHVHNKTSSLRPMLSFWKRAELQGRNFICAGLWGGEKKRVFGSPKKRSYRLLRKRFNFHIEKFHWNANFS